jgi:hypothetical protein
LVSGAYGYSDDRTNGSQSPKEFPTELFKLDAKTKKQLNSELARRMQGHDLKLRSAWEAHMNA